MPLATQIFFWGGGEIYVSYDFSYIATNRYRENVSGIDSWLHDSPKYGNPSVIKDRVNIT